MKIYVPSMDRWRDVGRGPLQQFTEDMLRVTSYVVPPEQSMRYATALCDAGFRHVDVLECPEQGIAATRHWIGRIAQQNESEKFIAIDDDVHFVVRKSEDHWALRYAQNGETEEMFLYVSKLLDRYGHVGIGTRQGNNNHGAGTPDTLVVENTRTLRALAYRTEDFLSVEHRRVPVMEDFDVNLQLLRLGIKNCSINFWAQDQKMTNAPGGCSGYRTHALHESAARTLAELHPGLVRLVQKKNKTGGEFGTRTEVVISWKKAYQESQRG